MSFCSGVQVGEADRVAVATQYVEWQAALLSPPFPPLHTCLYSQISGVDGESTAGGGRKGSSLSSSRQNSEGRPHQTLDHEANILSLVEIDGLEQGVLFHADFPASTDEVADVLHLFKLVLPGLGVDALDRVRLDSVEQLA